MTAQRVFTSKRSFEKAVKPSGKIQRLVLENGLGRPVTIDEHKAFHLSASKAKLSPIFLGQIKPRINLWSSTLKSNSFPKSQIPEVAVTGRTNCGKSQLINSVCGQIGTCLIGSNPGTTRKINFYQIGSPTRLVFVDMPGYGYAPVKDEKRVQWLETIKSYIETRSNLKRVIIAIDSRVGLKRSDLDMLSFLENKKVKWQAVLTKCDLVVPYRLCQKIQVTEMELSHFKGSIDDLIPISALRNQNLNSLRSSIEKVVKNYVPPPSIISKIEPPKHPPLSLELNMGSTDIPVPPSPEVDYLTFDQVVDNNVKRIVSTLVADFGIQQELQPIKVDTLPSLLSSSVEVIHENNILFDFEGVDTKIDASKLIPISSKSSKTVPETIGKKYTFPLELPKNQSTGLVKQMPMSVASQLFPRLNPLKVRGSLKYRILGRNRSTRLQFSALRNMSRFNYKKEKPPKVITDWNKIYAKYVRWSRKHPELASEPVSKAVVMSEFRYEQRRMKNPNEV